MKAFFKELFEYSHHYNQKLIELLTENSDRVSEKSIQLMNHTINAHQIWNSRITGNTPLKYGEIHSYEELEQYDLSNYLKTLKFCRPQILMKN
ncbi:MAG: hypothetical protein IPF75_18440 [Bacteroidetes bacterium]|nr:hypothetical protein [Bacteroidota bacterium]